MISTSLWSRSVVPAQVVLNPLNLYHRSNKALPNGDIQVKAVDFSRSGSFLYNKKKVQISPEAFEEYRNISNAVQRMIPDDSGTDELTRRGTAFHIGSNLVLTNNHVLDPTFRNSKECADFRLTDYQDISYSCKEVLYCNKEHDVCLIEMKTTEKTVRDCTFCAGTKKTFALADGPSLKLKMNHYIEDSKEEVTTAIGNSGGQGIHYSQGRGVTSLPNRTYFYAPITNGNSGGPLLNSDNEVIGVVKQQSKITISDDNTKSFNVALPTNYAVGLIREALENNPVMLRKFNEAVIE